MEKVYDKKKTREQKQQTSGTSNLESASSSYNNNAISERKANMKGGRINKSNDGQNVSADDCQLRNLKEKSSRSSDEYENSKEPEMSTQSQHTDGSDESDDVEHDVKVCDTCGDAGREYLLATCSRCIDGAEHTYCMKKPVDQVPKGDWLCEECKLEDVRNTNRVSGKRPAEELVYSSSFKKQALDVDRGKVKLINQVSSDSRFGNESAEGSRSPATRPHLQSLRGAFSKSSSFSFSNARSKTKLVDEIVLQRQKSTKEHNSHDTTTVKEISKLKSFRSTNSGPFGPSGSKVKMLSPKSPHLQDLKSPKSNKERTFEKTNSVKLLSSRGETNSVSSGSNTDVKPVKGDSKIISGLKSTNRLVNISAEAPVSLGQLNEQPLSSPTRVSSSVKSVDQKSVGSSSKVPISKESTNLADGITTSNNVPGLITSKDVKNKDNKLKDAVEAALLKKPGIYRKNKVRDQSAADESTMNNEQLPSSPTRVSSSVNFVDQKSVDISSNVSISKESTNLADGITTGNNVSGLKTSKDVKDGDNKLKDAIEAALLKKPGICRKNKVPDQPAADESTINYNNNEPHLRNAGTLTSADAPSSDWRPRQSNGNSSEQSIILPSEVKPLTAVHDDVELSSYLKHTHIPDHECIWHYEKSYQVLLEDMMRGDLALIGSINGVELLIFPSNRLPEKANRWNMLFFLWGVLRGKKMNSSHQIPNYQEKNCFVSSVSTDKISLAENGGSFGAVEKDKHVDLESKVNPNLQNSSHEKGVDIVSIPVDNVNVVPVNSKEIISESEPIKRPFIDLDINAASQTDTWHDASGQQEDNCSKKKKSDNGERPNKKLVFPLDLNKDISCAVGEMDS